MVRRQLLRSWFRFLSGSVRHGRRPGAALAVETLEDRSVPSVSYFLKLDGITGPATDAGHVGEFRLTTFRFDTSSPGRNGMNQPVLGDLEATTSVGQGSAGLLSALVSGGAIDQAVLTAQVDATPAQPSHVLATWTLSDVLVTSIGNSGASATAGAAEAITLQYSAIQESVSYPDPRDASRIDTATASWDGAAGSDTGPASFGGQTLPAGGTTIDFGTGQAGVLSFQGGLANTGSSGQPVTQLQAVDFTVSTRVGATSPALFAALTQGTTLQQDVSLTVFKQDSRTSSYSVFEHVTLTHATVTGDGISGTAGDDGPVETFTLGYAKIVQTVTPDGTQASAVTASWDFATGTGSGPAAFGGQVVSPAAGSTVIDFGTGQSPVLAFATDFANPVAIATNGGLTPGGAAAGTFQITVPTGAVSPAILGALTQGGPLENPVVVTTYRPTTPGQHVIVWQQLRLSDVVVTSDTTGITGDGVLSDTFTLQYGTISEEVDSPTPTGGVQRTTASWDLLQGGINDPGNFGLQTVSGQQATLDFGTGQVAIDSFRGGFTSSPAAEVPATLHEFQLTAAVGQDSPGLLAALASGAPIGSVVLTVLNSSGQSVSERFTLGGVYVSSDAFTTTGGGLEETFTLAYHQVKEETFGVTSSGTQSVSTTLTQTTEADVSLAPLSGPDAAGADATGLSYFLGLSGVLANNSNPRHPNDFDVLSITSGAVPTVNGPLQGEFHVTLPVNEASAHLLQILASGQRLSRAVLSADTLHGNFATWTLSNVIITTDGPAGIMGGLPAESIDLNYSAITETISPSITASWDGHTGTGPTTFGGGTVSGQPITLDFGSGQVAASAFSIGLASAGSLVPGDLVVTMPAGAATPAVLAALTQGAVLGDAVVLTVTDTTNGRLVERLTLEGVRVGSDQLSFGTGGSDTEETIHLRYDILEQDDFVYTASGHLLETESATTPDFGTLVTVNAPDSAYTGSAYSVSDAQVVASGNIVSGLGDSHLSFRYYSGSFASSADLVGVTPLGGAPVEPGTYTVVAHYAGDGVHYTSADSAPATFSITTATPSVEVTAPGGSYDGMAHGVTDVQVVAAGNTIATLGDSNITVAYYAGAYTRNPADHGAGQLHGAPVQPGTYTVVVYYTGDDYHFASAVSDPVVFSITAATPSVEVTAPGGSYDGMAHGVTDVQVVAAGNTIATLGDSNITVAYYAGAYTRNPADHGAGQLHGAPVQPGTYTVVVYYTGDEVRYASTNSDPVVFSITSATPVIQVTAPGGTYDAAAIGATDVEVVASGTTIATLSDASVSLVYFRGAYDHDPRDGGVAELRAAPVNAGTYTVIADYAGDNVHYASTSSAPVTFTIQKADATVHVNAYSVTYDGATHAATGSVTGVDGASLAGLNLSGTVHTDAGTYGNDTWTFTDSTGNYNNAGGSVADSIARADAQISVLPYSGSYDGKAHGLSGTATGALGEDLGSLLDLGGTYRNAGKYVVAWSFAGDSNYNSTGGSSAENVAPRNLTVSAAALDKVYDGTTSADVSLTDDRVAGDQLTVTDTGAAFSDVNVGMGKTVTVSGIAISGQDAGNYTITATTASATASITARPITITASPESKVYGTPDPALAYQVTGGALVNGDAFSGALSRQPGEDVGSYAIWQGTLTAGGNYALSYVGASLTITPATVTVALTTSTALVVPSQGVTFTAVVTPSTTGGTAPSGSVVFSDGNSVLGSVALVNGTAAFTTNSLATGSHSITASYAGSINYVPGVSAALAETVQQAALEPDVLYPGQVALFVGGNPGTNVITVKQTGHDCYQVSVLTVAASGATMSWQGTFASSISRVVARGGPVNNAITVDGSVKVDAWLYGGAGNNILEGGGGNNVLIGGPGSDVLMGGNGRDLLIGGGGADMLLGGGGDDILLAGTTDYSANDPALLAVMKEWTRADADYATRVAHLTGNTGGGWNGGYVLNATTVHDDGATDWLEGDGGHDLYFDSVGDAVIDSNSKEVIFEV
jgi:type VI protein secretion system component Hcp